MRDLRSTLLIAVATCAAASCAAPSAAGYVYADYEANPRATIPSGVAGPLSLGWVSNNAANAGAGVVNDGAQGLNAWVVTDGNPQLPNPSYVTALDAQTSTEALRDGWRFEALARLVDDFDGPASMGLTVFLNQRAYHLMLDLNGTDDLQATVYGRAGGPTALTTGRSGTAAYHRFSLESSGGANVTAKFDGQPIGAAWTGVTVAGAHANIIQWGNSNQALAGVGAMAFQSVKFEIDPVEPLAADGDQDGDVDGADLLRWQRTFGSTTQLAADANHDRVVNAADLTIWRQQFGLVPSTTANGGGVPEPSTVALAAVAAAMFAAAVRQSAGVGPARGRSKTAR